MTTRRENIPYNSQVQSFSHDSDRTRTLKPAQSTPNLSARSRSNILNESREYENAYGGVHEPYYCSSPVDNSFIPHHPYDAPHHSQNRTFVPYRNAELDNAVDPSKEYSAQQSLNPSLSLSEKNTNINKDPQSAASLKARLKVATAFEDTSFFLGGLIKHPIESNKHLTILRHSHGLVYYKGPDTSVAISIFSDRPLPLDRRMWLQLKGWTGNTGMAAKALFGSNNSWINVTPQQRVDAVSLPPLDERAWQRDIKKFNHKASKTQQKHILRETTVVRIPYEANDGYFRIVLTGSDSMAVLCPSPVFRVASTSMSASTLKGASLTTIPLELGVKVAQTAAKTMATTVIAPWAVVVKDRITTVTSLVQSNAHAQTAWDTSGMQNHVNGFNEQYAARQQQVAGRPGLDRTVSAPTPIRSNIVGPNDGPELPFPLRLKGFIAQGTEQGISLLGMPTAILDDIPPDVLGSLSLGAYFGWTQVIPNGTELAPPQDWCHAIINIAYSDTTDVAPRKCVQAYLIHGSSVGTSFVGSKLKLVIMGYLRPPVPASEHDVLLLETFNDIAITQASLTRPAWGYEDTLHKARTAQSAKSMTQKMVDLKIAGQRQVDRVHVHTLGVRNDSSGIHDRGMYGNGGVWVKRD